MQCRLILEPITNSKNQKFDVLVIDLKEKNNSRYISEDLNFDGTVYSDVKYNIKIEIVDIDIKEIFDVEFYINDEIQNVYVDNEFYIKLNRESEKNLNGRIFLDYWGCLNLVLKFKHTEKYRFFHSNYIDVAINSHNDSQDIKNIAKYVLDKSNDILFENEENVNEFLDLSNEKNKSFLSNITIIEKIIFEYEKNILFFKRNKNYEIKTVKKLDNFEKITNIDSEQVRFIVSNPSNLNRVEYETGIKYKEYNYLPQKTLIKSSKHDYDIYENRIVLSFIRYIYEELDGLLREIEDKIESIPDVTTGLSYESTSAALLKFLYNTNKLSGLKENVLRLYYIYKDILRVEEVRFSQMPKPTSKFINTPHYRTVYLLIKEWFEYGKVKFDNNKKLVNLTKNNKLYEYYVLLKINNYFINKNYTSLAVEKIKNDNLSVNNYFKYKWNDIDVEIYYEPIIGWNDNVENIGLIRAIGYSSREYGDTVYTPDYVIRVTKNNISKYIILDAKWSNSLNVSKYFVEDIMYKYYFNTRTIKQCDEIVAVWIVNGKKSERSSKNNSIVNFYNSPLITNKDNLKPSAKLLSLNEFTDDDLFTSERAFNELFDIEQMFF